MAQRKASPEAHALVEVNATLDAIGVEQGSLELRLAYLRGAALGLRATSATDARLAKIDKINDSVPEPEPVKLVPVVPPVELEAGRPIKVQLESGDTAGTIQEKATAAGSAIGQEVANALEVIVEKATEFQASIPNGTVVQPHHPDWRDAAKRRSFFAGLQDLGVLDSYEVIAGFCEAHGLKRPSMMSAAEHVKFLTRLGKQENRSKFDEWCAIHGAGVIEEAKAAKRAK